MKMQKPYKPLNKREKVNLILEMTQGKITPAQFKNQITVHPPEVFKLENGIYTLSGTSEKFTKEEFQARDEKRGYRTLTFVYNADRDKNKYYEQERT